MRLQIHTREVGGVDVLDLNGDVVMGLEAQELRGHVQRLLADGKTRIVLNLKNVAYIDSSGVGEFVACFTTMKKNGGVLKFVNPGDFVSDVLRAVRLTDVLDLYDNEEAALASFDN